MRHPSNRQLRGGFGAVAGALVLSMSGFTVSASAVQVSGAGVNPDQTAPVTAAPAAGTPELTTPGPYEVVRQLAQCGTTMYAVGAFTSITQTGTAYTRDNIFSFSATAPYTMTTWAPDVNGRIDTIAFAGTNCADAYIGGDFTSVNGTAAKDIAEIDTTTGALVTTFAHDASAEVNTIAVSGTHVLAGGDFTTINGSTMKYYVSLNTTTGANDGYVNFNISGTYEYPGVTYESTKIYNQQVSHGGARVMVEGVFTSVGGQARQQIFQEWLGPKGAQVTGWTSPGFNGHCYFKEPFYVRTAAWAPNDNTVYVSTTGGEPYLWNHTYPLTGMCDSTSAISANEFSENPSWVNYTGCDSLYTAVADDYAVYVAGHPRWSENANDCNAEGPGAVVDAGLQGLNPSTGEPLLGSNGTAMYTMSRANADDEILTPAGLWIASTNRYGSDVCIHNGGHAGICFLPYSS